MRLQEFLEDLAKTPRSWQLEAGRKLRNENGLCPAQALHRAVRLISDPYDLQAIILAADGTQGHDPVLRAKLLKACDLA